MTRSRTAFAWIATLGLVFVVVSQNGCQAVRGRRGEAPQSGFLGDYSQVIEREGYEAQAVYFDPGAQWQRYDSIQIDTVSLWLNEENHGLSDDDRQMLTDLLYASLHAKLEEKFKLVEQAGPNTVRLRAALTQAKGARVAARTISSILPPVFVVSTLVGLSSDVAKTVGTATIEVEVLDSVTGERLAAAVDERAGTKSILAGKRTFQKWGDVKAACEFWAERVAAALVRAGLRAKS